MPNHNNTTELEKLVNGHAYEVYATHTLPDKEQDAEQLRLRKIYTQELQNLIIKERQSELAQTVLAGMPELTPKQQEFVENRLQALEKH